MLFSHKELRLKDLPEFKLSINDDALEQMPQPCEILFNVSACFYPPIEDTLAWQRLYGQTEFTQVTSIFTLMLFSYADDFTRNNFVHDYAFIDGSLAQIMLQSFQKVVDAKKSPEAAEALLDDGFAQIAIKLLQNGFFPLSFTHDENALCMEIGRRQKNPRPHTLSDEDIDALVRLRVARSNAPEINILPTPRPM